MRTTNTSRLLDARLHSPVDVKVIKGELGIMKSVAYNDGVAFLPEKESGQLVYHPVSKVVELRPSKLKNLKNYVQGNKQQREQCLSCDTGCRLSLTRTRRRIMANLL